MKIGIQVFIRLGKGHVWPRFHKPINRKKFANPRKRFYKTVRLATLNSASTNKFTN